MRIAFRPRRGVQEIEIRDITGGHPLSRWSNGDERDVADDELIAFRAPTGEIVHRKAIDALLSCGPDFVDATSGKNPTLVCAQCGEHALDEHFTDLQTAQRVDYVDENGARLCLRDWLTAHPEYDAHHVKAGLARDIVDAARAAREKSSEPPASSAVSASTTTVTYAEPYEEHD